MIARNECVFQFKISLMGIKPKIWRRIQVPEGYTFWDFHVAIQDAMGWEDYHLHEFIVRNPATGAKESIGIPDEDFQDERPMLPGWEEKIAAYFTMTNSQADYIYDFGDEWRHKVVLEKSLPREKGVTYPVCIAGERSCPPEDCGGVWGYEEFLEIMGDPDHKEHEGMKTWIGGQFDPERFDPKEVRFDDPHKRWEVAFGGAE